MKRYGSMWMILIGVLFLCVSFAYAETAQEYLNRGNAYKKQANEIKINFSDDFNSRSYYLRNMNFTQAMANYNKALEINPNLAEAYNNRGFCYYNQGHSTQAISDYNKALEINPNLAEAYYNRSRVYFALREYDKAWADVHKAEELGYTAEPFFIRALKMETGKDK